MRFAIVAIFIACSAPSSPVGIDPDSGGRDASAPYECTGEDTHSNQGRHWPTGISVEVLDFTGAGGFMVERAVDDWNDLGIPVELVYLKQSENSESGKIIVRADPSGQFLGYAEVTTEGEVITSGQVSINPSMLGRSEEARRHVACQELGHTLGLAHIAGVTCMDDCSRFLGTGTEEFANCMNEPASASPNERDRCQLEHTYRRTE